MTKTKKNKYCNYKTCTNELKTEVEIKSGECDDCWYNRHDGTAAVSAKEDDCTHDGSPLVFHIGEGFVKAGGDRDIALWDRHKVDLVVNLTGYSNNVVTCNGGAKTVLHATTLLSYSYAEMVVSWKDMQPPPVGMNFFEELAQLVASGTNILVHCMGGHGRTGTALAALIHTAHKIGSYPYTQDGGILKGDSVEWLRKNYCKKAVESDTQADWLREAGVKTTAKGLHVTIKPKPKYVYHEHGGKVQEWLEAHKKSKKGHKGG